MSRRSNTPIRTGIPSLEASNQAQIDDLVTRNRTLEHTIHKLSEQLKLEQSRSKEAVSEIRKQSNNLQQEWQQGCDDLLVAYRLVQQQTVVELERERMNVIKEMNALREEKLLRLKRDYTVTQFQAREAELEDKIAELEEEREAMIAEYDILVNKLKKKLLDVGRDRAQHMAVSEKSEKETTKLRSDYATLRALSESTTSKLERVKLQHDTLQTQMADVKRERDELKRSNNDLKRQVEQWQSLENKGGELAETERKKRLDLEIELTALKEKLEEMGDGAAELAREKRRVEKMKVALTSWQEKAESNKEEVEIARQQVLKLQKKLEKVTAELEQRPDIAQPTSSPHSIVMEEVDSEGNEPEEVFPVPSARKQKVPATTKPVRQKPPSRPRPKPVSKVLNALPLFDGDPGPSKSTRSRNPVQVEVVENSSDSEIEEIDTPKKPVAKTQPKPKAAAVAAANVESEGSEAESRTDVKKRGKGKAVAKPEKDLPPKSKGKRKAPTSDEEVVELTNTKKGNGKAKTVRDVPPKKKGKIDPPNRASTVEDSGSLEDTDEPAPKKKKRKINIFPQGTERNEFAFNIPTFAGGGLDIPTELSPVKASEPVPSRSTSIVGSIGNIGSMLRTRLTGRL